MTCFHQLDFSLGLDLIIHSTGGYVAATESLINYIRSKFVRDIRVFIPQLAMSGGTILALSGREIWMGRQSNLGPIDPQFGSTPAILLLQEVHHIPVEFKADPDSIEIYRPILAQIPPTLLSQANEAIKLSKEIAIRTLADGMFFGDKNAQSKSEAIAEELTKVDVHHQHDRHIHAADCKKMGLIIKDLEDDNDLQDLVLSVHHAFMITLSNSPAAKIVENHIGVSYFRNVPVQAITVA